VALAPLGKRQDVGQLLDNLLDYHLLSVGGLESLQPAVQRVEHLLRGRDRSLRDACGPPMNGRRHAEGPVVGRCLCDVPEFGIELNLRRRIVEPLTHLALGGADALKPRQRVAHERDGASCRVVHPRITCGAWVGNTAGKSPSVRVFRFTAGDGTLDPLPRPEVPDRDDPGVIRQEEPRLQMDDHPLDASKALPEGSESIVDDIPLVELVDDADTLPCPRRRTHPLKQAQQITLYPRERRHQWREGVDEIPRGPVRPLHGRRNRADPVAMYRKR
jgi:hypothetical protein